MLIGNASGRSSLGIIKFKAHLNSGPYPLRISDFIFPHGPLGTSDPTLMRNTFREDLFVHHIQERGLINNLDPKLLCLFQFRACLFAA